MTPEALETLILDSKDGWAIQKAAEHLDEKDRAKLSTAAQTLFTSLSRNKAGKSASARLAGSIARRKGESWKHWNAPENRLAATALFAFGPLSAVRNRDVFVWNDERQVVDRILRDRRPDWLDAWIAEELDNEVQRFEFETLRGWIKDGLCSKPETDGYIRMFAAHLMRTGFYHGREKVAPISVEILADPGLLDDVPGLFRVENLAFNTNGWLTKGAADDHESWTDALVKLSAGGHLDRARLMEQVLEGLALDLKQNQLAGFHGLYRRMAPTREELLRHQPHFIGLLCHSVGHVAKFAIEMLGEIEKQGALDGGPAMREIQSVFTSEGKGNALAALKLIKRVLDRSKGGDPDALAAAFEALRHAHAEVQAKALDLIEKEAARIDGSGWEMLRELEGFVSASNKARLAALLAGAPAAGSSTAPIEEGPAVGAEAPAGAEVAELREDSPYRPISDDINAHAILPHVERIEPIVSVDALIDAVAHAIETVDSPDEVERIIDAISRLANEKPADFEARVAPLIHRIESGELRGKSMVIAVGVGEALLNVVLGWLTGRPHRTDRWPGSGFKTNEDGFAPTAEHLRAIAKRVANRQSQALLSAPTHRGGWIDPLVWVERLRTLCGEGVSAGSMDFSLSLLRLAPDNRGVAIEHTRELPDAVGRIARFALGGDEQPGKADRGHYAAWISAARCRSPLADWSAAFETLELDDALPDSLRPAHHVWKSSHTPGRYENQTWKTPELTVQALCAGAEGAPERTGGLLSRVAQAVSGRTATDWSLLPTAALNRWSEPDRYWASELGRTWVAQWLSYVWPQNPAAAAARAATILIGRMDEDSSGWEPRHGHFHLLFQKNRPWREPGHLLLCLGLLGKDADARGLAVDALIEGIDGRLFDPDIFAATMAGLDEGQWLKFNRLGDGLMQAIQVSPLHAEVISEALQKWVPRLDLQQKNGFRLLEVLVEAQAIGGRPLGADARAALGAVKGSGKAAKVAKVLAGN